MTGPVVLYIGGIGRSGSTVLAEALGSLPGIVSVGELHHFWGRGAVENWHCADGTPFLSHPIWIAARRNAEAAVPGDTLLQRANRVARLRQARHQLAHDTPASLRPDAKAYSAEMAAIYHSVAAQTGACVLIDSGKVPFHARLMQRASVIDLRVLHLIRDPRAIAYARKTPKPTRGAGGARSEMRRFPMLYTAARWALRNQQIARLAASGPYAVLRYEDFAQDPSCALCGAFETLNLSVDLIEQTRRMKRSFAPGLGLSFSGNPNRVTTGATTIRDDIRWKKGLSHFERICVQAICAPTQRRFHT